MPGDATKELLDRLIAALTGPPAAPEGMGPGAWVATENDGWPRHLYGKVEHVTPFGFWIRTTQDADHPIFLPWATTRIRLSEPSHPVRRPSL
jgi:hypothetical protein